MIYGLGVQNGEADLKIPEKMKSFIWASFKNLVPFLVCCVSGCRRSGYDREARAPADIVRCADVGSFCSLVSTPAIRKLGG
jgi:hypothetical protein